MLFWALVLLTGLCRLLWSLNSVGTVHLCLDYARLVDDIVESDGQCVGLYVTSARSPVLLTDRQTG